jgi:hypothetical protein
MATLIKNMSILKTYKIKNKPIGKIRENLVTFEKLRLTSPPNQFKTKRL